MDPECQLDPDERPPPQGQDSAVSDRRLATSLNLIETFLEVQTLGLRKYGDLGMLPRLGYLLHCVQRGYLDALSKYVSAVPTFKQYLTLKEGEEKRYVLSVKRKLTVVFQGNSPGIKDIIMNSTTIELSPRLIMTTDGGNDTEPEEGSQEEEDIPEKAVKSSPKKRAANNTGEEDASPKKKRAPAVSNPKLRNMIYGYLLQSTETSISVCVFRKYCPRNPKYFGREGIAEAVIKHFQTPEYDIKSRLY